MARVMRSLRPRNGSINTNRAAPAVSLARPPTYESPSIVAAPIVCVSGIQESGRLGPRKTHPKKAREELSRRRGARAAAQGLFFVFMHFKNFNKTREFKHFPGCPAQTK